MKVGRGQRGFMGGCVKGMYCEMDVKYSERRRGIVKDEARTRTKDNEEWNESGERMEGCCSRKVERRIRKLCEVKQEGSCKLRWG